MLKEIQVTDINGACVLRYLQLPGGGYFGGATGRENSAELDYGPHVYHSATSLLGVIGRLANTEGHPYTVRATDAAPEVVLQPHGVRADDLAAVLGLEVAEVVDYFGLAVRLRNGHGELRLPA